MLCIRDNDCPCIMEDMDSPFLSSSKLVNSPLEVFPLED